MGDGWTGLNVEAVKEQIQTFRNEAFRAYSNFKSAFELFNDSLYRTWASPKAVDFNSYIINLAYENIICLSCNDVLQAACAAASFMARYNGDNTTFTYEELVEDIEPVRLLDNKEGITGMNIPLAKMALSSFTDSVKSVLNELRDLPVNFALYDPAGELKTQYQALVKDAISHIEFLVEGATKDLNAAFDEESMNITMGKQQAEQVLSA